jgi:hypothetical protein
MNERIRELKEQAWEYTMAVHDGLIVPPLDKEVWPVDKVFDEKFAELIVKECIRNYRLKHLEYIRTGQYVDEYEHANNMLAQLGFEETFRS